MKSDAPRQTIDRTALAPFISAAVLVALGLAPMLAQAHPGDVHNTDALQAFAHPFTGIDHLLCMFCVGLWAALRGGRQVWAAPLAFVASMAAGAMVQAAGVALPAIEPTVTASVFVAGMLVAAHGMWPAPLALGLIGSFGLFHGAAHARELDVSVALPGMLLGTAVLHAAGVTLGMVLPARRPAWPALVGAATMAVGTALLVRSA